MTDKKYERAVALWLSKRMYDSKGRPLDPDKISNVEFATYRGGHCDTCAYESAGITFRYANTYRTEELDYSTTNVAQFVREVAELALKGA